MEVRSIKHTLAPGKAGRSHGGIYISAGLLIVILVLLIILLYYQITQPDRLRTGT